MDGYGVGAIFLLFCAVYQIFEGCVRDRDPLRGDGSQRVQIFGQRLNGVLCEIDLAGFIIASRFGGFYHVQRVRCIAVIYQTAFKIFLCIGIRVRICAFDRTGNVVCVGNQPDDVLGGGQRLRGSQTIDGRIAVSPFGFLQPCVHGCFNGGHGVDIGEAVQQNSPKTTGGGVIVIGAVFQIDAPVAESCSGGDAGVGAVGRDRGVSGGWGDAGVDLGGVDQIIHLHAHVPIYHSAGIQVADAHAASMRRVVQVRTVIILVAGDCSAVV